MELAKFCACMEEIAPRPLALDFDNVGLLVEPDHAEIRKVLIALDCTTVTAREAIDLGVDLLVTHHPQFFHGVKSIGFSSPVTGAAALLLRHGIGHYAAHTNLDAAEGGVNDILAELLGLQNAAPIPLENIGRVGVLPSPIKLSALVERCNALLNSRAAYTGDPDRLVSRIAVLGGAGGGDIEYARDAGAEAYITGEAKHNQILEAREMDLPLILCGHYETERVVLKSLQDRLQILAPDVQYYITLREKAPLLFS
ncbi:MAG: Nif3-like dinuclear metal center hexameric protein [Clostridia bacterium]|nr:Nif3-like dinuclear metal center hexameric protein [Clostridia bacterium]